MKVPIFQRTKEWQIPFVDNSIPARDATQVSETPVFLDI
jgi:hypothetical protein